MLETRQDSGRGTRGITMSWQSFSSAGSRVIASRTSQRYPRPTRRSFASPFGLLRMRSRGQALQSRPTTGKVLGSRATAGCMEAASTL